ncbi:MAG: winged helix DNA-binding domain-containing protein [Planctomycetota bacterium]|nr:winged helix DNA-binding domain-containing protein [Planctomycetota bacterium]
MRRSGLVKSFSSPEETARRLIGVQAQLMAAADLAFWNRTADCTSEGLRQARLDRRGLVRMWGQRDTLHIFAADDWPLLHAAFELRDPRFFKKLEQSEVFGEFRRVVRQIGKRLAGGKPLTYKDVKSKKLVLGIKRPPMTDKQAAWAAGYIVFRQLVREGVACHGPDEGNASCFVHRERWLPDLDWSPPEPKKAFAELAVRYLSSYGPAEDRDLAHWYGMSATNARRWIESAGKRCRSIEVAGRTLWCRRCDLEDLAVKPPPAARWPVRLLYRFDPLVLGTGDKSWLIDEADYKKVWRPSAHVEAVVLVRGRIAGTWRYDRKSKGLCVRVHPFGRLNGAVLRDSEKQAAAIAGFLAIPLEGFEVVRP